MDRDEALAICFANLKGPKDKDLLATAEALRYLRGLPEYGSNGEVGKAVGVSREIVREFLTLLEFPRGIRDLFEQGKLKLEHGRRLWQLKRRRPDLVAEMAEAMTHLSAMDARHLVEYILKHPELSVTAARKRVLESKTVTEREFHVIALLPEREYKLLSEQARKRNLATDVLVTSIVERWLQSQNDDN